MKDLPKVFANHINKELHNTQEVFNSMNNLNRGINDKESVVKKINRIFASSHHVYKSKVKITLKNDTLEKVIVGKTNTDLITINGELIKIIDIIDIEKI